MRNYCLYNTPPTANAGNGTPGVTSYVLKKSLHAWRDFCLHKDFRRFSHHALVFFLVLGVLTNASMDAILPETVAVDTPQHVVDAAAAQNTPLAAVDGSHSVVLKSHYDHSPDAHHSDQEHVEATEAAIHEHSGLAPPMEVANDNVSESNHRSSDSDDVWDVQE